MTRRVGAAVGVVALIGWVLAASPSHGEPQAADSTGRLPDPVAKSLARNFPSCEILQLSTEDEDGVTVYDIELKEGDTEKETGIASDGTMLELTVVITPEAVPADAMKRIRRAAKGATLGRTEHIEVLYQTRDGELVQLEHPLTRYAAEMSKGERRAEIVVSAEGAVVEPPKWVKAAE